MFDNFEIEIPVAVLILAILAGFITVKTTSCIITERCMDGCDTERCVFMCKGDTKPTDDCAPDSQ